ncbi:hypothetical protein [Teredinibacter haidensis]|uniref:hypothetical protein n=1 Tax=Teredinibacter haidensis TaxID=2731755 RepID=UPI0009489B78|nr:hypothetical protein [Teredinibacter haidensis]
MSKGIFLLIFICVSVTVQADVYKCSGGKNGQYYADTGCANGEVESIVVVRKPNISMPVEATESVKAGYELFFGPERIGHEPEWTLAQAFEHLRWYKNKNSTTQKAKGYYNGTVIILRDVSVK